MDSHIGITYVDLFVSSRIWDERSKKKRRICIIFHRSSLLRGRVIGKLIDLFRISCGREILCFWVTPENGALLYRLSPKFLYPSLFFGPIASMIFVSGTPPALSQSISLWFHIYNDDLFQIRDLFEAQYWDPSRFSWIEANWKLFGILQNLWTSF